MLDSNSKIHIVGGTGVMGLWLRNFLESLGIHVTISDEKIKPGLNLQQSDFIFISVPIAVAPKVILETAKKADKACLIIDLSSVKSETAKALKECKRNSLSLHFLFGPSISSIKNQRIIYQTFGSKEKSNWILKLFENEGAQIIELNSKAHDFLMAHIQSLTHFINLTFAQILMDDKIGLKGNVSTPVHLSQLSAAMRVLSQNPKLLGEIQVLNPEFLSVLENFLKIQKKLIQKIKGKKILEIEEQFMNLRKSMESVSVKIVKNPEIHKTEKSLINDLNIGYLGPKGTFSNQAVLKMFSDTKNTLIPAGNIYDMFEDLDKDKADLIVAPAENTIEGTVRETLDLLFDYNAKIIGKIDLEISQCLLSKGRSLKEIKKVISHPQALNQSRDFLNEYMPGVILESSPSTIASVAELKNPEVAIIGPELAAKIYNLNVLKKDIQNSKNNTTRFYVISKKDILNLKNRTKSLLFLSVFNRVGILRDILSIFADLSINLNKIESRPSKEKNWDYYFFIEIELTDDDPRFNQALNILKQYCPTILVLGKL
ncbi:prephenate dehydratase [Candidatus Daviesbacteria bacterium]|nr:prephenate dehydratase [Candidatus Daviesbacteria bacterium]